MSSGFLEECLPGSSRRERTLNNDEKAFGIVILSVDSEESARRIMNEDPAVRDGIMRAELYPYRIAFRTRG